MNEMITDPTIAGTSCLPLTREQEALWVEWKLSPTGVSYNTCVQTKLRGDVDIERFAKAASDVAGTFQLLRAFCHELDGKVEMRLSNERYQIDFIDVSDGVEEESADTRRKAYATLTRRRDAAIDLTRFPLIRAALVKSGARDFYFIGVVPHIISDGFSALFVLQAISVVYDRGLAGLDELLGDERKDWSDYLAWRAAQDPEKRDAAIAHWQQALAGANHHIPICQHEGSVADTHGKRRYLELDSSITAAWSKLTRSKRTSLFSALAALYAAFLYRQTDHDDIIIAHPVNQRPAGFRFAFGFYVNVVPLRIDLSGQPSFSDLVERVGKTRRADRKHHHLPSLDIVQAKRQVQSDFDGRLTNVSMGETVSRFQGMSMEGIESMGVDNDVIDVRDDLSLMYEVAEDRIGLWIEYRNSAFDEAEIDKLVARLQKLVAAIQQDPERPIAEIDILEPGEREQIVAAGDGGPLTVSEANTDVFTAATLAEAFARSAAKHGDAPAVFFRSSDADSQKGREVEQQATQQLSYRELEQRVRAYAALLRNDIGATSKPIAVCLPRSPQQLIALLATMASGHSYVPLDPSIPNARALAILQDCGALHLITTPELSSIFNGWTGTQIAAPEVSPLGGQSPGEPKAEQAIQPANAHAYVIYTSGSTGLPKGVRVSHRAVLQRLAFLQSEYALTPSDRMLTNTSYTFDVSVAEIFWPLLAGASLVIAEEEESRDPRALRQLISTHGVSCTCIVPSALTGLLTAGGLASSVELEPSAGLNEEPSAGLGKEPSAGLGTEPSAGLGKASLSVTDALASLRLVLVAGEALPQTLAHDFHTLCDGRMVNLYGPTEGTIYASATDIDPITSDITIGKAIAATQLYIINSATQLQPFGTEGELAIGGDALAEGYLGREELNLERFQPNPFATGRIYKTGDRARMRPDGVVEYLGRADAQVKLRGFRIELGEIEHLLREHAAVSDAAVLVDDGGSRKQLLAYYEGAPVPGSELRGFLESRVPSYMVPNRIERIQDGIPRLPSGKLNRGALPKTTDGAPISITAPRTEREKSVAECWAKVLDVPTAQIGLESNFFELGGDSLLLISLVCELEAKGLFVEVHELFDNPTVAGSLPFLQQEQEYSSNQSPVIGSYPALARHRKLFADGFAHPAHWNRCILVDFHRLLDQDALQEAANAVSAHHDGLRLSFHEQNGDISFRFHPPGAMETTLSYLDLSALPAEVREKKKYGLLNELNESFDLAKPPLIKIAMIDDERRSTVALIVHHLLIDMRSCQVLLEDLLSSYQAAISHRSVRLPRKTSSLAEWTQALHAHIDQQWKQEELSYWQHELAGVSQCLPEGRALPDSYCAVDADQRTSALAVGKDVTERLVRGVAPRLDVGMQDIVLAAFAAAFRRWAGLNELVLNTCGVGRDKLFDDINLTRTVGELNTVYPLRISLEADNLLTTVAAKLREVPARGLHYGMLRYIAAHHELADAPEPEVFFNYVSRIDTALGDALGAQVSMAPSQVRSSHPDNRACYRLYAEASIYHGALELDLGYDSKRFTGESIAQLLAHWKQELEALATLRG